MRKVVKVFFNFSARSSQKIFYCSKIISSWLNANEYISTYDSENNGSCEQIYSKDPLSLEKMFDRATRALAKSDLCILEVSTHSLSQGYLLQKSLEQGKPTIALYLPGKLPAFAAGIHDSRLQVLEYNPENLINVLEQSIAYASEEFDIRFNMMLSPALNSHLKHLSKTKKISRSSCVRQLIRDDMIAHGLSSAD